MSEKKLYEVRVTRVPKKKVTRMLAEAETKTGDEFDLEDVTLDDIYDAADILGVTGTIEVVDFHVVHAWAAETAQSLVAERYREDDFSIVLNIEVSEAEIWEA